MKRFLVASILICCVLGAGCRSTYYSFWEKMGKEKRDLLQKKVKQVRDEQQQASEQLKDALTRLQELYGFKGGQVEKVYRDLQSSYDRSKSQAESLRTRIRQMDQIARDLFKEWQSEANSITTPSLRENSLAQLRQTQQRYEHLYAAVTRAGQSMEPVLTKLRDYVLYLKHNLNAQAISALQGEATSIQEAIARLIADMNASIRQADEFIKAGKQ